MFLSVPDAVMSFIKSAVVMKLGAGGFQGRKIQMIRIEATFKSWLEQFAEFCNTQERS
jgi:hypothetical protein